jgi:hypothetical protein
MEIKGLEKWGDSVVEDKLSNGNTLYYVEREGMYFEVGIFLGRENKLEVFDNVNEALMSLIIRAWKYKFRIRVFYGDIHTGRSWNEEYDVMGMIGRTTGDIKIPILIHNRRSWGGGALLLSSVIRIDDIEDKRTLWKLPNFHVEKMTVEKRSVFTDYPFAVMQTQDSGAISNIANFKTAEKAQKWVEFMEGKRYSK